MVELPPEASSEAASEVPTEAGSDEDPKSRPAELGLLVVGHGHTASALLSSARRIVAPPKGFGPVPPLPRVLARALAVDAGEGYDETFERGLRAAVREVDGGVGLLVLVDLIGSSPCNCCLSRIQARDLHVVTGVNLAMLLKLGTLPEPLPPVEILAALCQEVGRRAILHRETPRSS